MKISPSNDTNASDLWFFIHMFDCNVATCTYTATVCRYVSESLHRYKQNWKQFPSASNVFIHYDPLHPGRLTWNLQITHLERKMIFQTSMIMFHVNRQGCTKPFWYFVYLVGTNHPHLGCHPWLKTISFRKTMENPGGVIICSSRFGQPSYIKSTNSQSQQI